MRLMAISCFLCALAACTSPVDPGPGSGSDAGATVDGGAGAELALPFAVDDWFAPSGYMGDGSVTNGITDTPDCSSRGGDGRGVCHHFVWDPSGMGWAGVYWQYPDGNWGAQPGLRVPGGATQVSFYAWAPGGSAEVGFMVGMADVDGFEVKQEEIELGTSPQRYTLSLADTGYTAVVGGFGWVAADSDTGVEFIVDDIAWE